MGNITVEYQGQEWTFPEEYKYITLDDDGDICVHIDEPTLTTVNEVDYFWDSSDVIHIGEADQQPDKMKVSDLQG